MKKLMNKIRTANKGFTLVELIIVIAIIAVLSAVTAPQYIKYVERSKGATDADTFGAVIQAVNVLIADGTITKDETFTWDKTNGGIGSSASQDADKHNDEIVALTGTIGKPVSAKALGESKLEIKVTFDSNTKQPKVEVTPATYATTWGK